MILALLSLAAGAFVIGLFLAAVVFWFYGLILTLRASFVLFLICLLVHVPFIIFGLAKWGFGVDLPREIAAAFNSRGSRN